MNTKQSLVAIAAAAMVAAAFTYAFTKTDAGQSGGGSVSSAERGKYLVHEVALCIDCHSPRGPDGQFAEGRHLTGSPLAFVPTVEMPWTDVAPPIAGLPGYTREQAVVFFMTGERPTKTPVLPPMPAFRMSRADAEAVADYLFSLRPF